MTCNMYKSGFHLGGVRGHSPPLNISCRPSKIPINHHPLTYSPICQYSPLGKISKRNTKYTETNFYRGKLYTKEVCTRVRHQPVLVRLHSAAIQGRGRGWFTMLAKSHCQATSGTRIHCKHASHTTELKDRTISTHYRMEELQAKTSVTRSCDKAFLALTSVFACSVATLDVHLHTQLLAHHSGFAAGRQVAFLESCRHIKL